MRRVGPILYFRGQTDDRWRLSALIVAATDDTPGPLRVGRAGSAAPILLHRHPGGSLWRYDFALPLGTAASTAEYGIGGQTWTVALPARAGARRLAYTACNGTVNETPPARNELWVQLAGEHRKRPFHLLLQGGDQLYADSIWRDVPALRAWKRLPWRRAHRAPFTPDMAQATVDHYFNRYCWLWAQPELAPVLASVPSIMMWDDHDVFDGWGSWPDERQACPVFQGVGSVAREYFTLFQLAAKADDLPDNFADPRGGHFGCAFKIGGIGIAAPDLRSGRTRRRVMDENGWHGFLAGLEGLQACRSVLIMSSVPLVNADLSPIERLMCLIPRYQRVQDDLRDQWQSMAHRDEWARMLRHLADFSARTGAVVTSLSGEIHLGAFGVVESGDGQIYQLTASGIVNPPPPAPVVAVYEWLGRRPIAVAPGLSTQSLKIPGHNRRFLRRRNWLSLDLTGDGGLTAVWHTAHGDAGRVDLS